MRLLPLAMAGLAGASVLAAACGSIEESNETTAGSGATGSGTAGTGSPGAGGSVPMNSFAAPHPAPPRVYHLGGPVLKAPKVYPIYFSNDEPTLTAQVTDFLNKVGSSRYWKATTEEYGVGPASAGPAIQLAEAAPAMISDSAIQTFLAGRLNANDPAFPAPDDNTIFAFVYPKSTTVVLDIGGATDQSCKSFASYHSQTKLDAQHGSRPIPYMVIPRCASYLGFMGVDVLTVGLSHELIEAANDPFPLTQPAYYQPDFDHFYWLTAFGGAETADMCALSVSSFVNDPEIGYRVQRSWSNKEAAASNEPCVPAVPGEPYFNSAPVLPDKVDFNFGGAIVPVTGVRIPVGQTRTVEVDLFSDQETSGPWTVEALDISGRLGGAGALGFQFDKQSGKNGDKLKLAISVLKPTPDQSDLFMLISTLGTKKTFWVGFVSNVSD